MKSNTFAKNLILVGLAALLTACGALPTNADDSHDTSPQLPASFAGASALAHGSETTLAGWAVLGDPVLTSWIRRSLEANLDLRQAAERVQRSRALAAGFRAARGPVIGASLGGRAQQLSEHQAPGLDEASRRSESVGAGLDLSWEIDLFGRLRKQAQAAQVRVEGSEADAQALALSISAELAHVWYALASARERRQITLGVIDNRRATLNLVQRRKAGGYSAALDEARARYDLAAAEADVPALDAEVASATHRLAVLLGELPGGFTVPEIHATDSSGVRLELPATDSWLSARPDLRAAEALLRAHALDVEAVRADFYPRLSVTGFLGFVAGSAAGLGAAASTSWFVAPSVSVPVFDSGRIQARLDAARSQQREALLNYRQKILLAVEEVENAIVQVAQGNRQLISLHERNQQALRAETLARHRYEAGASDLLELLDAQRNAHQAQLGLSGALAKQRQHVVTLLRALGSGAQAAAT